MRTSQPAEVQLVINITRKRGSSQIIIFEKPSPRDPLLAPIDRNNIVALALQLHAYLAADPTRFHDEVALKFGTSRPQVSQYLKLVDQLPPDFINRMKTCKDQKTLRRFSGRTLIKISKLRSMDDRQQEIEHLLIGYKEQKVV